jgi:hypothetical protein
MRTSERGRTCRKYDHSIRITWALIRACIVRRYGTPYNAESAPGSKYMECASVYTQLAIVQHNHHMIESWTSSWASSELSLVAMCRYDVMTDTRVSMFLCSVNIRDNTHELIHAVVKSLGIPWALSTLAPGLWLSNWEHQN